MKYATIVADPPWPMNETWAKRSSSPKVLERGYKQHTGGVRERTQPYLWMSLDAIRALPVADLATDDARLYLWTTNRFLPDAFSVVKAWGFRYVQTVTWCKKPKGINSAAAFVQTTEFVLVARRGTPNTLRQYDTTWFQWPRSNTHSQKPEAFLDLVEQVSPGPYLEMFARKARFGWDYWGDQSLGTATLEGVA